MKILMYPRRYELLTGSELYHYELARELVSMGHEVTVVGKENTELGEHTLKNGIKIEHPFQVYRIGNDYDVIHCSHFDPTSFATYHFSTPVVQTINSEHPMLWQYERPHPDARAYIAIRPTIGELVPGSHLIYNPIDFSRFNKEGVQRPIVKTVLFPGTLDILRRSSAMKLKELADSEGFEVVFMGVQYVDYGDVRVLKPDWHVEKEMKKVTHVASILHGRTVFEAWACGLPAYVFKIDDDGNYVSHTIEDPPEDMTFCDSRNVARKVLDVYKSVVTN